LGGQPDRGVGVVAFQLGDQVADGLDSFHDRNTSRGRIRVVDGG
jgi:hypothetical protein